MGNIVVRPVRFSADVPGMQAFLEVIGLRPRIEARGGGWVDLSADSGMVALHDAATSVMGAEPGQTTLSFEANDLDSLADALRDAGVPDITIHDEAYGRVLSCTDPLGDPIWIDGRTDDLYGYRAHPESRPEAGLAVTPVRFTEPQGPYADFLVTLGLTRLGEPNESYVMFDAGDAKHGYVGLHHVYTQDPADLPIVAGQGSVHLTFSTHESLDAVAARLVEAGYGDAHVMVEDFGSMLSVTDPDGQEVQVHEAPSS
jgi:uncharacterized glyoxalase superfamily protein PhnB